MNEHYRDMSLGERVAAEAEVAAYRREAARQSGTAHTLLGPTAPAFSAGDRIRELGREIDEAERAERAARGITSASGLIRTLKEDWPKADETVRAFAKRRGITLGEAWATAIEAVFERFDQSGG